MGAFFQLIFQPAVAKGSGLAFPPLPPPPASHGTNGERTARLLPPPSLRRQMRWEPEEEIDGVCRVSLLTTHHGPNFLGPFHTTVMAMAQQRPPYRKKQPGYICWEMPAALEDLPLVPSTADGMGDSELLLHGHIHVVMGAQCKLSLSDSRSLSHTKKNPVKKILPKAFCMSLHCRGSPKVLQSSSGLHSACTRRYSRALPQPLLSTPTGLSPPGRG